MSKLLLAHLNVLLFLEMNFKSNNCQVPEISACYKVPATNNKNSNDKYTAANSLDKQ